MAQTDLFAALNPDLPDIGPNTTIAALAEDAAGCTRCHLYKDATQTVFGQGPKDARLLIVGEQPGDKEDLAGEPFVGPAGRLLDEALEAAGVSRTVVYLTNAVKHFRHTQRGKRRLHQKPELRHLVACHPWLEAELRAVDPEVVVALGATAGRAVLGRTVRVGAERGQVLTGPDGRASALTTHPSALLRLRDRSERQSAFDARVADLATAAATTG